ncbi:APC family permease [Mycolicibacterium brisbanense]|uniref:Putative permease, urea carboxylase system n=1 Tax=Mycolicibacterium brisbanense TaxID=146020 RepID=A0A117I4B1_9MYCO|nr:APC family permease [Mycolicibacterium brisbanense]MCV7156774.1 amino acid permease [Mycolicibacterium brisbanense]GAS86672.1 putative permease, urea carboxylase system [Mycolicibacterium brisbanense]
MTHQTPERVDANNADEQHLARLGYRQELQRTLGSFSTFAAGFAFISILTGAFQLFFFAFSIAGPPFWWTWLIAFGGQMLFGLCFAELSTHYPIAGSVYNWSKHVGGKTASWLAGFSLTLALIVSTAAVALAMQFVLPTISDIFWIYGDGSGPYDAATNGVILGAIAIVVATVLNSLPVRVVSLVNNVGVIVELIASVFLIVFFFFAAKRGPQVVFDSVGHGHDNSLGLPGAMLMALLLGCYIMWGFDTAGSLGEETVNPRRTSPMSILRALAAAGLTGALLMLGALMAVGDLGADELSTSGLPYVVQDVLGKTLGDVVLGCVVIAIFVCILANQTGAMRMMFAMSRDNALPASSALARVNKVTRAPILTAVITGVIAIGILVLNVRQPQIFVVVTSTTVVLAFIAYSIVSASFAHRRLTGQWQTDRRYFHLGRFGIPVSIAATVWGIAMIVNVAWPRQSVYNPAPPYHWYLQWGAVLFCATVIGLGYGYYRLVQRHRIGVLPEHAAPHADGE